MVALTVISRPDIKSLHRRMVVWLSNLKKVDQPTSETIDLDNALISFRMAAHTLMQCKRTDRHLIERKVEEIEGHVIGRFSEHNLTESRDAVIELKGFICGRFEEVHSEKEIENVLKAFGISAKKITDFMADSELMNRVDLAWLKAKDRTEHFKR